MSALDEWLVRGSACAAFAVWCLAEASRQTGTAMPRARTLWLSGAVLLTVHITLSFQLVHHWSHAAAFEATARQTAEVTGWQSGVGLWVNYAVIAVWLADVAWWRLAPCGFANRPRAMDVMVRCFLAFMWFNAVVVFGHGWIRVAGAVAFVLLAVAVRRPPS